MFSFYLVNKNNQVGIVRYKIIDRKFNKQKVLLNDVYFLPNLHDEPKKPALSSTYASGAGSGLFNNKRIIQRW